MIYIYMEFSLPNITLAGRYYLVKGGYYNFCIQGGIMNLMLPMGGIKATIALCNPLASSPLVA